MLAFVKRSCSFNAAAAAVSFFSVVLVEPVPPFFNASASKVSSLLRISSSSFALAASAFSSQLTTPTGLNAMIIPSPLVQF